MLFRSFFRRARAARRPAASAAIARAVIETLEDRRLLTVAAPTGMTATVVSDGEIHLAWTNNEASADAVEVERSTDGGTCWSAFASVSTTPGAATVDDYTVLPASTYKYRAYASKFDSGLGVEVDSTDSNVASGTIPFLAPSALTAYAVSGGEIDLAWTNNADNADAVEVERSVNGGSWMPFSAASSTPGAATLVDTSVYPTSTYRYQVYASAAGESGTVYTGDSAAASASIDFIAPDALVASAVSGSEVDLSWQNNADNAGAVEVERSSDGGATWTGISAVSSTPGAATYADTSVSGGTYLYAIEASASNGDLATTVYADSAPVSATLSTDVNVAGQNVAATEGVALSSGTVVATFTSNNPSAVASNFSASINWGDTHTTTGTVIADPSVSGQFDVIGGHTYAVVGIQSMSVTVSPSGGSPATVYPTAVVAPPVLASMTVSNDDNSSETESVTGGSGPTLEVSANSNDQTVVNVSGIVSPSADASQAAFELFSGDGNTDLGEITGGQATLAWSSSTILYEIVGGTKVGGVFYAGDAAQTLKVKNTRSISVIAASTDSAINTATVAGSVHENGAAKNGIAVTVKINKAAAIAANITMTGAATVGSDYVLTTTTVNDGTTDGVYLFTLATSGAVACGIDVTISVAGADDSTCHVSLNIP